MNEEKIGFWELPPNEPAKFWRPPDLPGCGRGRDARRRRAEALLGDVPVQSAASGRDSIIFLRARQAGRHEHGRLLLADRALLRLCDVRPWARRVRWRPRSDRGVSPPSPPVWSYRGNVGETCTTVCNAQNLMCDENALSINVNTADELADAIAPSFMCQPPLIQTCTDGAPRMSGLRWHLLV